MRLTGARYISRAPVAEQFAVL